MKIHIVQKGDTLWKIAQKYGVDFEKLKQMNTHLSNPNMIMPGMKIKVPTQGVPVKKKEVPVQPKEAPVKEKAVHPYIDKSKKEVPVQSTEKPKEVVKGVKQEAPKPQMPPQPPMPNMTQQMYNYNFDFNIPQYPVMPGTFPGMIEDEEESPDLELPKPKKPTQVAGVQDEAPEVPKAPEMPQVPPMPMPQAPMMPPMPMPQHCVPMTGVMPGSGLPVGYPVVPMNPYHAGYGGYPQLGAPVGYPGVPQGVVPEQGYPQAFSPAEMGAFDESPEDELPNIPGAPGAEMPYGEAFQPQMSGYQPTIGAGVPYGPQAVNPMVGGNPLGGYPQVPGYPQIDPGYGMNQGFPYGGAPFGYEGASQAGGDCGCGGGAPYMPQTGYNPLAPHAGYNQPVPQSIPYGPYQTPTYPPYGLPVEPDTRDMDEYEEESN